LRFCAKSALPEAGFLLPISASGTATTIDPIRLDGAA
jgi:hypothetical protein